MKQLIIIHTAIIFLYLGCTPLTKLSGRYSDGKHMEFLFTNAPNTFDYYLRSEMGVLEYSSGSWIRKKRQVILNGFTENNARLLNVEDEITDNSRNNDEIIIRYAPASNLVRTCVIINDASPILITTDTTFSSAVRIKTVRVKSYLSYTGLLSSQPRIDTLYSSKIEINDVSGSNKNIVLNFAVHPYDFSRVSLNDTLIVKSNRILYLNKIKLKK